MYTSKTGESHIDTDPLDFTPTTLDFMKSEDRKESLCSSSPTNSSYSHSVRVCLGADNTKIRPINFNTAKEPFTDNAAALQTVLRQLLEKNDLVLVDKRAAEPRKPFNPGPLGLLGFGMTTILLNFHNAGAFDLGSVVPAMGVALGGGLQIIAGLLEVVRGKAFPATAFLSYGAFWLSLVAIWLMPQSDHPHVVPTASSFLGVYLMLWCLYTGCMTVVTYVNSHIMMRMLFTTLTVLFALLSIGNFAKSETVLNIAGYEGIVCGAIAMYIAFAEILEDNLGRSILPVFPMK